MKSLRAALVWNAVELVPSRRVGLGGHDRPGYPMDELSKSTGTFCVQLASIGINPRAAPRHCQSRP